MVEPMAKAAIAVGADGLVIEVHNNPERALCDGAQALRPERFCPFSGRIKWYRPHHRTRYVIN